MSETKGAKSWFGSLPGVLTTLAATLTAAGAVIAAIPPLWHVLFAPEPGHTQDCIGGYVWRQAIGDDNVCVTLQTHQQTLEDNLLAGSRRNPAGGGFGADSCLTGYVWRDAFEGDHVCVTPDTRTRTAEDNRNSAARIKR